MVGAVATSRVGGGDCFGAYAGDGFLWFTLHWVGSVKTFVYTGL